MVEWAKWLWLPTDQWPSQTSIPPAEMPTDEKRDVCLHVTVDNQAILPVQQFSSFSCLKRVTALVRCFVDNCRKLKTDRSTSLYQSSTELATSESCWISLIQHEAFAIEIESLIES